MTTVPVDLLLGIADGVAAVNAQGRIVLWNDAAANLFGVSAEAAVGMAVSDFISRRFIAEFSQGLREVASGVPRPPRTVIVGRAADGRELTLEISASVATHNNETIVIGVFRELKERFRNLALLRENERQLQDAESLAGMGSFHWNVGSDEISWSAHLARLYGYEPGKHPTSLAGFLERVHPDDRSAVQRQIATSLSDGTSWSMEERIIRADNGETRILSSAVRAIRDANGRVVRLSGICHDITESRLAEDALASAEASLRERTLYDPLTSLPNRALLLDRLNGALRRAERANSTVALFILDLDNFSVINDTVGHANGDVILTTVAMRLLEHAHTRDAVARTGGDEFMIICDDASHADVHALARTIASIVSEPIPLRDRELRITASIGIATSCGDGTADQLLHDADLALNEAQKSGNAGIALFNDEIRHDASARVAVEEELRRALGAGHIVPYYQPIFNLMTGRIVGFEALARWDHPQRGVLAPKHFLSIAEDSHLIGALGETMLRQSCAQLRQWQASDANLTMAVNISLRQLNRDFVTFIERTLSETSIAPGSLHVEVTESVLLDMHKEATNHLNALAALGVQLGIDDFGTGYSSLLYIKRFPVRFLKIDRSFVEGLPENVEDAAIVSAVLRLAESLELTAVAEGVETREQQQKLQQLGCSFAQGYFLAMPQSAKHIDEMLKTM